VPAEFTSVGRRSVVKHSTKVRVSDDRNGRQASRIAQKFNEQLEGYWCSLAHGLDTAQISRYEAARRKARTLGFDYVENDQLIAISPEKRLERLEALVTKGVVDDPAARAALLGTERRSGFLVSKLFEEYQSLIADEMKSMSPNQLRVWRLGRARAVRQFVEVTGDKPITEITQAAACQLRRLHGSHGRTEGMVDAGSHQLLHRGRLVALDHGLELPSLRPPGRPSHRYQFPHAVPPLSGPLGKLKAAKPGGCGAWGDLAA
jgi:hypothetical protein